MSTRTSNRSTTSSSITRRALASRPAGVERCPLNRASRPALSVALLVAWATLAFAPSAAAGERDPRDPPAPSPRPIQFELPRVQARPGQDINVPLVVRSEVPLVLVCWSVEYDPASLEFHGYDLHELLLERLESLGIDAHFQLEHDAQAGWIQAAIVFDYEGREQFAPPSTWLRALVALKFHVADGASGSVPLVLTRVETAGHESPFHGDHGPVYNGGRRHGRAFDRETRFDDVEEPDLEDGEIFVSIIGDVGVFVRGDSNSDFEVDIADPIATLEYLFQGRDALQCPEAADANGDGEIDVSDPVTVLNYLFRGSRDWQPAREPIYSTRPDSLGCYL